MSAELTVFHAPRPASTTQRKTRHEAGRPTPAARDEGTTPEVHPYAGLVNPHLSTLLARLRLDKSFVRGQGSELFDEQGRRYLDCVSAYGALPFGFNPPEIWEALRQVERTGEPSLVQPSLLGAAGELAARLVEIAPEPLCRVTFANSGAEAVEAAIKLCRIKTGRPGILSTINSFHGKTLGALSATGNPNYQRGCGAPCADFASIPYGDIHALEHVLAERPGYFAAFLIEPIQGEGGIVVPPSGYLAAVRDLCTRAGVLLVFDEIQTGLGRTGDLFACEHETVIPDVMTLAKALGGGLMPIGAVLCTEEVYTEAFALKHSSTFAGNTLACRAGIAALELLTREDHHLLKQVRRNGARLIRELDKLQALYPHLITEVRGRGYMIGLHFNVHRDLWPESLLGVSAEQNFLTPILASYLLNVEGIRVAPTLNGNAVIRIEPALNFTWKQCEELLVGLERTLQAFAHGDTGQILGSILEGKARPRIYSAPAAATGTRWSEPAETREQTGRSRFAFLMHPLDIKSYVDFDPTLASLPDRELTEVASRISGLVEPFVFGKPRVTSKDGTAIDGHFIVLPWTAEQFAAMEHSRAVAEVKKAVELARSLGCDLVGLGAFTSIVTRGGLDVSREGIAVTTGNSFTAVASAQAVVKAMDALGERMGGHTTAAVIGSTGAIGRAMALLLASRVGRMALIGNPERTAEAVRRRLLNVATDLCRHVVSMALEGQTFLPGTLADQVMALLGPQADPDAPADVLLAVATRLEQDGALVLTQDLAAVLPAADVVVAATSATGTVVRPEDIRPGAVVCDLSKPANVGPDVIAARPDVLVIDGGIIAVPGLPDLGRTGLEPGHAYACMAETMMLTLEGHFQNTSLGSDISAENLRWMQTLSERHGFEVARLRTNGRTLDDADWNRLLAAREASLGHLSLDVA